MWLPDYCILFPEYNRVRILNKLQSKKAKALIEERHRFFIENGVYRTTKINSAEILAVKVRTWIDKITHDLAESVSTYKNEYSLEKMTQAMNAGLLTKF
jgi:hypothetical protein